MVVLDKDLVLNLPFSEGSGSRAYDRSKHQNHGTISGALAVGALEDGSGWLLDWDKRLKITIDHDDIDSDLTDFPILIPLGTSVGIDSDDVSCVFDEVGANSLKIAVTDSSGVTQCYVEIERWDNGNELAWLWVKVPSVSSSVDTILYLYYDNDHANNSTYVGAPDSVPAENVWDTNFKFVTHMQDDPDNAHVRDSTTNDNDGTKKGANEPIEAAGRIDKAQDFDGGDDYVEVADHASLDAVSEITIEAWIKPDTVAEAGYGIVCRNAVANWAVYQYATTLIFRYTDVDGGLQTLSKTPPIVVDEWQHVCVVYDDTTKTATFYHNGVSVGSATGTKAMKAVAWDVLLIGMYTKPNTYPFSNLIDEVRVSDTTRPAAYTKASYESGRDHLVTFGSERDRASDVDWRFGKVLHFDGVNDYVSLADDPSLQIKEAITLVVWVKTTVVDAYSIIGAFGAVGGGFELALSGGKPRFLVWDSAAVLFGDLTANTTINDGEWHHVVVTYDMINMRMYIDGTLDNLAPETTEIGGPSVTRYIGSRAVSTFYAGLLDEIRFYKRVLTPEEILTLYEKTTH